MKNLGITSNFLMGIVIISSLFEKSQTIDNVKFAMVLLLGIGFSMLAYELNAGIPEYSPARGLIILIFLANTFWCPLVEPNLILSYAILASNLLLVKKSSINVFGYIITCAVFSFRAFKLVETQNKSFITILAFCSSVGLVLYYLNKLFGKKSTNLETKSHQLL